MPAVLDVSTESAVMQMIWTRDLLTASQALQHNVPTTTAYMGG